MPPRNTLPEPDPVAAAYSAKLVEQICSEIAANGGAISFTRFMELALYAPGLGYYSAGAFKFGAGGDFITAPEISPLFSHCLAHQCQQVLEYTGGDILELGAGSGIMAADLLSELETLGALPVRYRILELSADLRQRQQATLSTRTPHLLDLVQWLESLPLPGFRGVILGNEVLDAMPVQRFRITEQGPRPLWVSWKPQGFYWQLGDENAQLSDTINALQKALGYTREPGYESEFNPHLPAWLTAWSEVLDAGLLLFLDYGYPRREYYHPQRHSGTLICHYRHRAHPDPLILPGLQDITANVDFTAVAEAAVAVDLQVIGYTRQSCFLLGCGLEEMLAEVDPTNTRRYLELTQQVKRLTLPEEMGDRFKAIALSRELAFPLRGFGFWDERERL